MPKAFVLINTEIGFESEILDYLKKIKGIDESYALYGVYDLIAMISAETMDKLKNIIYTHIRGLDKVRTTLTMMIMED